MDADVVAVVLVLDEEDILEVAVETYGCLRGTLELELVSDRIEGAVLNGSGLDEEDVVREFGIPRGETADEEVEVSALDALRLRVRFAS
mmetsp:Transcript_5148/g.10667  ORF Transcript_5148/g.10667 Transcript_5148/m.10667 type:complete len:89 (+) Transcript_5148:2149-2415(+)